MHEIVLTGCRPEPLADYLKGLALLRLVAEQVDPEVCAWWAGDRVVLRSQLDAEGLQRFLLEDYAPTPLVTPWNGGSGFFPKDKHSGIAPIEASAHPRFAPYREAIAACRAALEALGISEKPSADEKPALLEHLRAELPDATLAWFDAALVVAGDRPLFPPLLGTGGNDGRLEFANNQMQRLTELLLSDDAQTGPLLRVSLFGGAWSGLSAKASIGQFDPAGGGGANAGQGFEGKSKVNPWDYVLAMEGALVFAAAVTRRLESAAPGTLAFPFSVRAVGVGYASASLRDEGDSRDELWLPMWSRPTGYGELRRVFSEGRAKVGGRPARDGVDFARAVAELGVDRGLTGFTRFGLHQRNGRSYYATPLGRWRVPDQAPLLHLGELDRWLGRLRREARRDFAPSALARASRAVDEALLGLCQGATPARVQAFLIALGRAEAVVARSPALRDALRPLPPMHADWLTQADDGSVELRLAASLAAADLRRYRLPIARSRWDDGEPQRLVWGAGGLERNLLALGQRFAVERRGEVRALAPRGAPCASLGDLAEFIEGRVDDARIEALAVGLGAVGPPPRSPWPERPTPRPPAVFSALALVWWRVAPEPEEGEPDERMPGARMPDTPGILRRAASGGLPRAVELALRRLAGAGWPTPSLSIQADPARARRVAAALAFPLSSSSLQQIARALMPGLESNQESTHDHAL